MNSKLTLRDIAGLCPEEAIWKMMTDVSAFLLSDNTSCHVTPESVAIDGTTFMIETGQESVDEFFGPEQIASQKPGIKQMVWSLGAVAYYIATGHVVFGGHGGVYQKEHPSVPLPVLQKDYQALTPILQKCLCYNPEERISMKELSLLSQRGLNFCERQQRKKNIAIKEEQKKEVKHIGEKWPEEMIEV